MTLDRLERRSFLASLGLAAATALATDRLGGALSASADEPAVRKLHLSCNQYSWATYYQRDGKNFGESLDAGLGDLAQSGYDGFEPSLGSPEDVDRLGPLLKKHGLQMRSFYVNSSLHDEQEVGKSIDAILAIAKKAKAIGSQIVVTNPNPLRWGGPENKSDAQLTTQAAAMNQLGRQLGEMGMMLAYHNHDIELRCAAREFHHMMVGTEAKYVSLCLDAHWIYRGSGNSSVALFDIVKLYGQRICELHLRQSSDNIWSEVFGKGDIDYTKLAAMLADPGKKPLLVMEQAPEGGTPKSLNATTALGRSAEYARTVFAPLGE